MRRAVALLLLALTTPVPAAAGYTHYWTWKKTPDPAKVKRCVAEMKRILSATPVPLAGVDGTEKPQVTEESVAFNLAGPGDDIGEPFVFPGATNRRNGCKTNMLKYDPVVTACLLAVMEHFSRDEVEVSSDGKITGGDWGEGADLFKKALGRAPKGVREAGLSDFVDNINLKPSWPPERLLIAGALLGLGAVATWFMLNPRPQFTIRLDPHGNATFLGRFPQIYADAAREFFSNDLTLGQNAEVRGWVESGGRFRLDFAGGISDKEQQRVRNFFGALRKRS